MKETFIFYIIYIVLVLYGAVAYIANLIQLFNCDFEGPWKEEIIHLMGALLPPISMITVWF